MAIEQGIKSVSFDAGEDLSSYQYYLVKMSADDTVKSVSGSTQTVVGVLQNEPESGETAEVAYGGISKILAGSDLDVGDFIGSDSNGKGQPITGTPSDSTIGNLRKLIGVCTLAASSGEVGSVMLDSRLA